MRRSQGFRYLTQVQAQHIPQRFFRNHGHVDGKNDLHEADIIVGEEDRESSIRQLWPTVRNSGGRSTAIESGEQEIQQAITIMVWSCLEGINDPMKSAAVGGDWVFSVCLWEFCGGPYDFQGPGAGFQNGCTFIHSQESRLHICSFELPFWQMFSVDAFSILDPWIWMICLGLFVKVEHSSYFKTGHSPVLNPHFLNIAVSVAPKSSVSKSQLSPQEVLIWQCVKTLYPWWTSK